MAMQPEDTRDRVMRAAGELFAERGFHAATMRDITARACVNLAAGHYHYGSKKDLYLTVLRAHFAEIRAELARRNATLPARHASRDELLTIMRARIRTMIESILGPPIGIPGTLMLREMIDPSEALPVIVDEFMRPMMEETRAILRALVPDLSDALLEKCGFSIVGQVMFYRATMPAILLMRHERDYSRDFLDDVAEHILQFSLGGLQQTAQPARRQAKQPRRPARTAPRSERSGAKTKSPGRKHEVTA